MCMRVSQRGTDSIISSMFGRKKMETCIIPVSLDEPLTNDSCTKLIMELLKYILYQKQQIPFSYDTLAQLQISKFSPSDRNSISTKTLMSSLKNIAENLTCQLYPSRHVREVVIIIGATTVSPRFCIRLELSDEIFHHPHHQQQQQHQHHHHHHHSSRQPLLNLMRSINDCREFQEAMAIPLGITNTFVLLQKPRDNNPTSDFFLPKPQYVPPTQTTTFAIKFHQNSPIATGFYGKDVIRVYHDLPECSSGGADTSSIKIDHDDFPYLWYQSREVIKGFKYAR